MLESRPTTGEVGIVGFAPQFGVGVSGSWASWLADAEVAAVSGAGEVGAHQAPRTAALLLRNSDHVVVDR